MTSSFMRSFTVPCLEGEIKLADPINGIQSLSRFLPVLLPSCQVSSQLSETCASFRICFQSREINKGEKLEKLHIDKTF